MTLPVPNMQAALVEIRGGFGYLIKPWNSYFQQFNQAAPAVQTVSPTGSPFSYTANNIGQVIVSSGTVSSITFTRGTDIITLFTSTASPRVILVSIGDTVTITYSVLPTVQFVEL